MVPIPAWVNQGVAHTSKGLERGALDLRVSRIGTLGCGYGLRGLGCSSFTFLQCIKLALIESFVGTPTISP